MIYTNQSSKLTKKQREKKQQLLEEQRAIKKSIQKEAASKKLVSVARVPDFRRGNHIPSVDSGVGVATKKQVVTYTGDAMIGIGQLHKSNAVPLFRSEDAVDIAHMRR